MKIPINKIYNTYIIETNNILSANDEVKNFAKAIGFDKYLVDNDNHKDLFFLKDRQYSDEIDIEKKSNTISIIDVKNNIIEDSYITPTFANKKIYVIEDAKNLSEEAQNALLKTLEDPPSYVIIFLITTNKNGLLNTILSRAIIFFDFDEEYIINSLVIKEDFLKVLKFICDIKYLDTKSIYDFILQIDKENIKYILEIIRYALKDALVYRILLDKSKLVLKNYYMYISTMANIYNEKTIGIFFDKVNEILNTLKYNVNIEISLIQLFLGIRKMCKE